MNNSFNFRRFRWYSRKELRENWKAYTLFPLIILVIQLGAIYQLCGPLRDYVYYKQLTAGYMLRPYPSLLVSAGITLWLVGSFSFRYLATPQKSLFALTLPVSAFERFCFAWIITVPVSLLLVYLFWHFSWGIATPIIKAIYPKAYVEYNKYYGVGIYNSVFIFVYTAAFMLGAVVFGRFSLLKTLSFVLGMSVVLYFVKLNLLQFLIPDTTKMVFSPAPYWGTFLNIETASGLNLWPRSTMQLPYFVWWVYCLPMVLWVITFLKLKEKEI